MSKNVEKSIEKSQGNIVLTGDRPTGKLHLGHYMASIRNRVALQERYGGSGGLGGTAGSGRCYYMIADVQALTDNAENPAKVRANVLEVALDNLACGLDPAKTTFFIQSQIPEIAELTVLFLNLVTIARLKRNPTVKNEMKQKGFGEDVPAGFLAYPVSQTADMVFAGSNIIPVGEDQLPVIEQANEIIAKFNAVYGSADGAPIFRKLEPMLSDVRRLVGIDGNAKASKSLGNAIFLDDDAREIERKVMMMYTDPKHARVEDPGHVKGNVVFTYLDIFDPARGEVAKLKAQYKKGGLGDVAIKKRLAGVLESVIGPIRARRRELARNPEAIFAILKEGTTRARVAARETMERVRRGVKIDYF